MKTLPLFSAGFSLLLTPVLLAQKPVPAPASGEKIELKDPAATEEPTVKLDSDVKKVELPDVPAAPEDLAPRKLPGLEKLSAEQLKTLTAGMGEVSNYLRGVRWQEALEKLGEVELVTGPNHYIENLRGAVYTRMRNFDKARAHFTNALELAKGLDTEAFHPKFNLAELDFVTKKWEAARDAFQKLLKDPGKPGTGSDTLINFKIMICDVQQKKEADADLVFKSFDQYDADSPAYYFAQAVKLFAKEDKEGASEWLESAKRIYPKEINEVYNDSLVEMGWLETLQ